MTGDNLIFEELCGMGIMYAVKALLIDTPETRTPHLSPSTVLLNKDTSLKRALVPLVSGLEGLL